MLVLNKKVKIKDLEKYGFKILVDDEEFKRNIEKDSMNYYCNRAYKNTGNHFAIVIENDEYENQVTIIPDNDFPFKMSLTWQLDDIYQLIKEGIIKCTK